MPPDPTSDELVEFILAQSEQGIAVPVMLFGPSEDVPGGEASAEESRVQRLIERLGIDSDVLELYSTEGYVLQCGLGQELLDELLRTDA